MAQLADRVLVVESALTQTFRCQYFCHQQLLEDAQNCQNLDLLLLLSSRYNCHNRCAMCITRPPASMNLCLYRTSCPDDNYHEPLNGQLQL